MSKRTYRCHKYHYVYKVTNSLNGNYYIGKHSTDNLDDEYYGSGNYIRHAENKYGEEGFRRYFKKEILCFCSTLDEAYEKEHEFLNSNFGIDHLCMNLTPGGVGCLGHAVITKSNIGKKNSKRNYRQILLRAFNDNLKVLTYRVVKDIVPVCVEESKIIKKKVWNKGIPASDRVKELNRRAMLGRTFTPEHKSKISEKLKRHVRSPSHCRNISIGKKRHDITIDKVTSEAKVIKSEKSLEYVSLYLIAERLGCSCTKVRTTIIEAGYLTWSEFLNTLFYSKGITC